MPDKNQISITADKKDLIKMLRNAFTNHTTFAGELLQNARRAGATEVHIVASEGRFMIHDNGSGISDYQKLLALCVSGWPEEVQKSDSPFGAGFIAAIYSAAHLTVSSGGFRFSRPTDDLLALEKVTLEPEETSGTTILLEGIKSSPSADEIANLVRGFPIPVTFNGELLDRPAATDGQKVFCQSDIGLVELPNERHNSTLRHTASCQLFLQGLPVDLPCRHNRMDVKPSLDPLVIHLDSMKYEGRFPDRNVLFMENKGDADRIYQAILGALTQTIEALKGEERHDETIAWHPVLLSHGLLKLLNDVPVLPRNALKEATPELTYADTVDSWNSDSGLDRITREDASKLPIIVADAPEQAPAADLPLRKGEDVQYDEAASRNSALDDPYITNCYMIALKAVFLDFRFDEGHWVYQLENCIPLEDVAVQAITPVEKGQTKADPLSYINRTLEGCREVRFEGSHGTATTNELAVFISPAHALVPKQASDHDICGTLFFYVDEFGAEDDERKERHIDAMAATLAMLHGEDSPETYFRKRLQDLRLHADENLKNQSFTVIFRQGEMHPTVEVTAA